MDCLQTKAAWWGMLVAVVGCRTAPGVLDTDPLAQASSPPSTSISDTLTQPTTSTTLTEWAELWWTVRVADTLGVRTTVPLWETACQDLGVSDAPCGDVDEDGLTDAWEDGVLERLRPAIRFDEAEPLITDPTAVLFDIGRVAPAEDGSGNLRAFIMMGYSLDYGRCGLSGHDGDSERVAFDLTPTGIGDIDVTAFYTAAHEGTVTDHGYVYKDGERGELSFPDDPVTGEPRWLVFSSDGKHATYGTVEHCEGAEWLVCLEEDCEADGVDPGPYTWLPGIANAGEEAAPRLTDLDSVGFVGDHAWEDRDFCGGGDGGVWGVCSSPVREKLLDDPF